MQHLLLYTAHKAQQSTHQLNIADQDNCWKEEEGKAVGRPYSAPEYGPDMAKQMTRDLEKHPHALQE